MRCGLVEAKRPREYSRFTACPGERKALGASSPPTQRQKTFSRKVRQGRKGPLPPKDMKAEHNFHAEDAEYAESGLSVLSLLRSRC